MKKNNANTIKKVSAVMAVVMTFATFGGITASADEYVPDQAAETSIVTTIDENGYEQQFEIAGDIANSEAFAGVGLTEINAVSEASVTQEAMGSVASFDNLGAASTPEENNGTKTTYYQAGDGRIVVVTRKKETNKTSDNFNASVDSAAKYYPGAIVTTRGISEGDAGVITELERNTCTMTVKGPTMKDGSNVVSVEFDPSNRSSYEAALKTALANVDREADSTANFHADYTYATSEEDIKASLNLSSDVIKKLHINFDSVMQGKSQTCIVSYVQDDFTVSVDTMKGTQPFTDADKAHAMLDNRDLDDQAAMINTASYGRRVYVAYTTNDTSFDLKAALEAEYGKVSGDAKGEYSEKLSNVSCNVYVNGGSKNEYKDLLDPTKTKSYNDVMNLLKATGNKSDFEHSEFLAYTASGLNDGRTVASNTSDTKYSTNITFKDRIPVTFKTADSSVNGRVDDFHVELKYDIVVPADSVWAKNAKSENVRDNGDGMVRISMEDSSSITKSNGNNQLYIPASVDPSSIRVHVGSNVSALNSKDVNIIDYDFSKHPTDTVGNIEICCDAGSNISCHMIIPYLRLWEKADIKVNGNQVDSHTWRQHE